MSRPIARYTPSRKYILLTTLGVGGALLAAWTGMRWSPAWIASGLFAASALAMLALVLQPAVEIYETHLQIGRKKIAWGEIGRLDQTGWNAPLGLQITIGARQRLLLVYPGDFDACSSLLRHLRRYSREALLDGVPYRQFWGEPLAAPLPDIKTIAPPKYPLLRPEDEEEVERMFQRLKSVGRLDSRGSDDQ